MSTSTITRTPPLPSAPGRGDWKETLGRVGLVGKGVMFAVVGLLAVQLASGDAANASKKGALAWVGSQPFGKVLLVALTLSLFALAAWRALDTFVGDPVEGDEAKDRVRYAVKALIYLSLAVTSLSVTISNWSSGGSGGSGSSGSGGNSGATATVLEWPGGRWIVAGIGLFVIGYALYQVKAHALDQKFTERLRVGKDHWVTTFGRFGYGFRAIVYVMIGWFFVQAAITYDPQKAKGMSGALQELAGQGWGQILLWVAAAGLMAYGVFALAESKYRTAA